MSNKIRCELCGRNKQFIRLSAKHRCICCDFRPDECKHVKRQIANLNQIKQWLMNPVNQKVEWLTSAEQQILHSRWQDLECAKNPKFWDRQRRAFAKLELRYCCVCSYSLVRQKRDKTKLSFCSKKHQGVWLSLQNKGWGIDLLNAYLINFYLNKDERSRTTWKYS